MKLNGSQMRVKYHCDLCAEKNRRKCYSKGVCRYADEMQGFEETDDRYIEMLNKRKAVKNVETGEVSKVFWLVKSLLERQTAQCTAC